MTTLQLAHQLVRRLRGARDLSTATASQKQDAQVAMNAALQIVYAMMPAAHKITTVSDTLRGPQTVAFDIPAKYENVLTNPVFTTRMVGCSVLVGDDPIVNTIVAPNALLNEYLGNALTGNATVYGDTIPLHQVIEQITGEPRLYRENHPVRTLRRQQWGFDELREQTQTLGVPKLYITVSSGLDQYASPPFFLRVFPLPDQDYKIRFEAELATARITFEQITQTPLDIPLHEHLCESVLLPIALGELTESPDWADPSGIGHIRASAETAKERVRFIKGDISAAPNEVGTPAGY